MKSESKEKKAPVKIRSEVLGETFEKGAPAIGGQEGMWRHKLGGRADKLKYLQTAERYWFGKE
jgi:hypothetical protein